MNCKGKAGHCTVEHCKGIASQGNATAWFRAARHSKGIVSLCITAHSKAMAKLCSAKQGTAKARRSQAWLSNGVAWFSNAISMLCFAKAECGNATLRQCTRIRALQRHGMAWHGNGRVWRHNDLQSIAKALHSKTSQRRGMVPMARQRYCIVLYCQAKVMRGLAMQGRSEA